MNGHSNKSYSSLSLVFFDVKLKHEFAAFFSETHLVMQVKGETWVNVWFKVRVDLKKS